MKGGARRKTISSELPPSPPPPPHPVQNEIDYQGNDEAEYDKQNREQEQHQQPMNDGGDGGNEYDEDEDDDFEEEDDRLGDGDIHGGEADESKDDEERPKLAEGFYEIEAVRKKRIRKGETQYLIKWRGWPEAANTWEPVENLMSCSDVIDAFEESMSSGKQRSNRKRKRKHSVAPTLQSKKKQKQQPQQRSPAATYDVPSVKVNIIEDPLPVPSVNNSNFSNGIENIVGDTGNNESAEQLNDNGSLMVSPQIRGRKERNELDVKLSELKGTSVTDEENMNEFAIHIQEDRAAEGVCPVEVRPANGVSKVDGMELIRVSPRIGAKRRKSFAVKRFKQVANSVNTNAAHDATEKTTGTSDVVGQHEIQNIGALGNGLNSNNMVDAPRSMDVVTKIIKPVNYSTSIVNGIEDVSVSFVVRRSNGEEVVVDNKYLKESCPLLLINFYEQHLRYNSPSE